MASSSGWKWEERNRRSRSFFNFQIYSHLYWIRVQEHEGVVIYYSEIFEGKFHILKKGRKKKENDNLNFSKYYVNLYIFYEIP